MKMINKLKNKNVQVDAPPSKAYTLRALIISSLAEGESKINNPLLGEDQLNVIESLKALGVKIQQNNNTISVKGLGGKYSPLSDFINVGESGVGMNFLLSAACFSNKPIIITGAEGLLRRPIKEVVDGLLQLGCKIEYLDEVGFPPVKMFNNGISGGLAKVFGEKTSQYFSSITIAAPYAEKEVKLNCIDNMTEKPYYDITLEMMEKFGVHASNNNYKEITIPPRQKYKGCNLTVEGDYSSASYFFLAAAICKIKVMVRNLSRNSRQGDKEVLNLLERMGCEVATSDDGVCVIGNNLKSIEADMSNIPDMVPTLAIAAAFAEGTTKITNIGHLRYKECDRLAVVVSELTKMGACAKHDNDSIIITGVKQLYGANIDPHNDHRIAMSFAIAGLVTGNQIIKDEKCVAKSFPDFWEKFEVFQKGQ